MDYGQAESCVLSPEECQWTTRKTGGWSFRNRIISLIYAQRRIFYKFAVMLAKQKMFNLRYLNKQNNYYLYHQDEY